MKKVKLPKVKNPFAPIDVPDKYAGHHAASLRYEEQLRAKHSSRFGLSDSEDES